MSHRESKSLQALDKHSTDDRSSDKHHGATKTSINSLNSKIYRESKCILALGKPSSDSRLLDKHHGFTASINSAYSLNNQWSTSDPSSAKQHTDNQSLDGHESHKDSLFTTLASQPSADGSDSLQPLINPPDIPQLRSDHSSRTEQRMSRSYTDSLEQPMVNDKYTASRTIARRSVQFATPSHSITVSMLVVHHIIIVECSGNCNLHWSYTLIAFDSVIDSVLT